MGLHRPNLPPPDGDDPTIAPQTIQNSLLGADVAGNTRRILVDSNRAVLVHVTQDDAVLFGTPVNVFSEVLALFATETTILTYSVPVGQTFSITRVIGWGDYDGEFLVRVDGTLMGGGRTSAAERTLHLPYNSGPIVATSGQIITVTIIHYSPAIRLFRANLLGGLL